MKILWHSNAPWVGSGYGNQTGLFTRLLREAGHDVVISAFYGHAGATLNWSGIRVLPGSQHPYGEDVLRSHHQVYQPDAMVLLIDVWVYNEDVLREIGATSWCPIDSRPAPPLVVDKARACKQVWSMSRFGESMLNAAGVRSVYVPHAVDTGVFKPIDRTLARQRLKIPEGKFVAACVAANKGYPPRKNLDKLIKAWARFIKTHPDSVLYLHTNPHTTHGGIDVIENAAFYGIPKESILLPDLYAMNNGSYTEEVMNAIYNAADVFVLPSAGEGFGIPAIEAAAAGCPVIVSDFTAQAELAGPGIKIPIDFDDLMLTTQGSEQALNLAPSKILTALNEAYERRGDLKWRADSRDFAMQYDARRVLRDYMIPALEAQRSDRELLEQRTAQRLALREMVTA